MYRYLEQLFDILNSNEYHIVIMAVFLSLLALALLLRMVVCTGYRSALFAFRLDAKELKTREDIKRIKHGSMRKIAAEYIRLADRSVSRIPTAAVIDRQVAAMSVMGWRYENIMPFVESLELGLLFVGLVLATVFNDNAFMYGLMTAAGFVLTRIAAAFFGFRTARQLYADELLIYTEREIGHFYSADTGGAVLRLKNELSDALGRQTEILKSTLDRFGGQLTDAVGILGKDLTHTVGQLRTEQTDNLKQLRTDLTEAVGCLSTDLADAVDQKLVDMNRDLQQPLRDWEKTLTDAGRVQGLINAGAEQMQIAGEKLHTAADLLTKYLHGHSNALSEHLGALVSAVEAVRDINDRFSAEVDVFIKQSKYIESNQAALDATVQSYEAALQALTRQLGDGLGAYLKLHAQTASQSVNDTLSANLEKVTQGNNDMLQRLGALFEQLREQNGDVSAHLLAIHQKLARLEPTERTNGGERNP